MKAAVVHSFDQPLRVEDVPRPVPGWEQVLVRIETCGLLCPGLPLSRAAFGHADIQKGGDVFP